MQLVKRLGQKMKMIMEKLWSMNILGGKVMEFCD